MPDFKIKFSLPAITLEALHNSAPPFSFDLVYSLVTFHLYHFKNNVQMSTSPKATSTFLPSNSFKEYISGARVVV